MNPAVRGVAMALLAVAPAAAQRPTIKIPDRPVDPPPAPLVYPDVTYDSLANGLRFAIVEHHELPLVVVQTGIMGAGQFGSWYIDSPSKPGAWGLMLTALREGTTTRSGTQISEEILDLGSDMRFTNTIAFAAPAFRAARSTWLPSLNLLADVMINASFPDAGFTRVQTALASQMDRLPPPTLANRLMMTSLFGPDNANTRYPTGPSLRALTRDDMVALHRQYMRPQNVMIVVAGDISVAEARAALEKEFGAWERGGTTITPIAPTALPSSPTTIYLKDAPGFPTAQISAAQIVPGRNHPDAMGIEGVAAVLGDFSLSAGSRVYNAFRHERGLSYSPRVDLGVRPAPEVVPLYATLATPVAMVDTAVTTLLKVLRELREEKPATLAELDFSRRSIVGRVAADLERVDGLASSVLTTLRDRIAPGGMARWIGRVNGMTLDEVRAAAIKYLDPDRMVVVVVADRSKVEAPLRATGIPVVIVP